MTTSTTRTYRYEPLGHDRYQVWYVETVCDETAVFLDTVDGIDAALAIEDAHKHRQENGQ